MLWKEHYVRYTTCLRMCCECRALYCWHLAQTHFEEMPSCVRNSDTFSLTAIDTKINAFCSNQFVPIEAKPSKGEKLIIRGEHVCMASGYISCVTSWNSSINCCVFFKVVIIYNCHTALEEWCLGSLLRCILLDSNSLGLFETIWVNIGFVAI